MRIRLEEQMVAASKYVVIRCDSSITIGTGHAVRCRNLGIELRELGRIPIFICRDLPNSAISKISSDFKVLVMSEELRLKGTRKEKPEIRKVEGDSFYSETEDADACITLLALNKIAGVDWIVLDHYSLGNAWESEMIEGLKRVQGYRPRVLAIDDLVYRTFNASVVVNMNMIDNRKRCAYDGRLTDSTKLMTGPYYSMMDESYKCQARHMRVRDNIQNIVIFMGGIDKENHTSLAIEALGVERYNDLRIEIVVGSGNPHRLDIVRLAKKQANTNIHCDLVTLSKIFASADVAIGAGGGASWERCCVGLPTLIIPIADNQVAGAMQIEAAGGAKVLKSRSRAGLKDEIRQMIDVLKEDREMLRKMSKACYTLGDGLGAKRVAWLIGGENRSIRIRSARMSDMWLYLWWRNDELTRASSHSQDLVEKDAHITWYKTALRNSHALLYVLEVDNALPIGQIRFERKTDCENCALLSYSLDAIARGKGYGKKLVELGISSAWNEWGRDLEIRAEVQERNRASIKCLKRTGFKIESIAYKGGEKVLCMIERGTRITND